MNREVERMQEQYIIRPSSFEYAALCLPSAEKGRVALAMS